MSFLKAMLGKVSAGLARTREALGLGLRSILSGQRLSPELVARIEEILIRSDVGVQTASEIRRDLQAAFERGEIERGEQALDFLKQQLKAYFPPESRELKRAPSGPTVILVCGINGAGKTTSIAKLCHLFRSEGRSVLLAAGDTFRAAAVDQLGLWAGRLGVDIVRGKPGGDPAAVAFDAAEAAVARGVDILIVDTAGRLHTQEHLMRQLAKIRAVLAKKIPGAPHETLLILDATTGQNGLAQAREFAAATEVTGILLSKLDGTARGGVAVAIRDSLGLPVKFIGTGETPADLAPFDPEAFVEAMFKAE